MNSIARAPFLETLAVESGSQIAQAEKKLVGSPRAIGDRSNDASALDAALLREVGRGNQLAMRTLFTRHQTKVYRFVMRMLRDRHQAEDVLSEVFLAVWQHPDRFKGYSTFSTWILAIARYKALAALRVKRLKPLDDDFARDIPDPALSPESMMHENESAVALRRSLNALSLEHREIIDLVYYQEKSVSETAQILDIPRNTVKTRMFYARKRLGALLAASEVEPTHNLPSIPAPLR